MSGIFKCIGACEPCNAISTPLLCRNHIIRRMYSEVKGDESNLKAFLQIEKTFSTGSETYSPEGSVRRANISSHLEKKPHKISATD